MQMGLIVILLGLVIAMILVVVMLLNSSMLGGGSGQKQLRNMVSKQRSDGDSRRTEGKSRARSTIYEAATESNVGRVGEAKLTVAKRMRYAQWKMKVGTFHLLQIGISIAAFLISGIVLGIILQIGFLFSGPLLMGWLLNRAVHKRFKEFDKDYPSFLLSLVGLLKTGMNPLTAIEAAAKNLEPGALIKEEAEMMLERLRYGVPEDASIGSFGEDVMHPEIELFVQALLLSRKVGGNLSETLERIARQVRKRQYFRQQAAAAVGLQRGSIWFIIGIMFAVEVYIWFIYPEAVTSALKDPMGVLIWQIGLSIIAFGIWWVKQVTKIKV